jgi:hypothetical protein
MTLVWGGKVRAGVLPVGHRVGVRRFWLASLLGLAEAGNYAIISFILILAYQ